MAWVRDGGAPDEIKVSFVVNKADHPELVEWLWGLPFRKQSSVIRDVLSKAAKLVSSGVASAQPAVTEKPARIAKEVPTSLLPITPETLPSNGAPQNGTSMTEATAAILRNMRDEF